MWKSLGFAIYWKRFCGFVVENEGLDSHGVQVSECEHVCELRFIRAASASPEVHAVPCTVVSGSELFLDAISIPRT